MFATYFYGCWLLPTSLTLIDLDVVKLGKQESVDTGIPSDDSKVPGENIYSEDVAETMDALQIEQAVPGAVVVGTSESSLVKLHGEDGAEILA